MFNFSKCAAVGANFHKVWYQCLPTSETNFCNINKCLKQYKAGVVRIIQIRCKSNVPPPPPPRLVPPNRPPPPAFVSPNRSGFQGIPFINNPNQSSSPTRYIMMLIPIISFGLGTWQLKRLKWKTDLINTINKCKVMDPVPLPLNPEEVDQMEFQVVSVKGVFDHENEFFYGPKPCYVDGERDPHVISKDGQGSYGYNLITPFIVSDSGQKILVNRGWLATKTLKKEKRPWSLTEGEQTLTGVVRKSEPPGFLVPTGDIKFNIWHFRDIESMALSKRCLPIYIDLTKDHSIPNRLWAGQTKMQLRNEHLSYALTWYALCIATSFMWYARYMKRR